MRLQTIKDKGWTDARIGLALDTAAGAVTQQWREQAKL